MNRNGKIKWKIKIKRKYKIKEKHNWKKKKMRLGLESTKNQEDKRYFAT